MNKVTQTILIGEIKMYAGNDEPTGWLKCDGRAVSRTTYSALFNVIGTTYGTGDGSTTFNLPDMRDRFPVGAGAAYDLNDKGGQTTVTLDITQIPSHDHAINGTYYKRGTGNNDTYGYINKNGGDHTGYSANTGGGQAHENMPPYIGLNFLIYHGQH